MAAQLARPPQRPWLAAAAAGLLLGCGLQHAASGSRQVEVRLQAFAAEMQPVPVAKRRQVRLLLLLSSGGGERRAGLSSTVA